MNLLDSSEWVEWVLETDSLRREKALATVVARASVADLATLMRRFAQSSPEERDATLRLLLHLSRSQDPRLLHDEANRNAWRQLLWDVVRSEYPGGSLGSPAFHGLIEVDRSAAERFLVEDLHIDAMPLGEVEIVIRHLGLLGTARALAMLVEIEGLPDERSVKARDMLERLGVVSRARLEILGQTWRQQRSVSALRRLYHDYLSELPEGTPIEDVIAVLGEPDRRIGQSLLYHANGRTLFLEVDTTGGLGGRSLV